mmetsp:Transcript_9298/g.18083  ORF Transcript_9298/g.18083 Transcript_9298/m.18083 type:complete len:92 (-) Transcript_9298:243-518(-)
MQRMLHVIFLSTLRFFRFIHEETGFHGSQPWNQKNRFFFYWELSDTAAITQRWMRLAELITLTVQSVFGCVQWIFNYSQCKHILNMRLLVE